jgi:type I restriction enzyme, S subunit
MTALVRLGDVCDIQSGGTPLRSKSEFYGGEIPWAKIGDIEASDGNVFNTQEQITPAGLRAIRGRIFPQGTLLFAMYGSIGKMAFAGRAMATNQAILGLQFSDQQRTCPRFVYHWLRSNKERLLSDGQGITQKNLSATYLRDLVLPLPPIDEQRRIAAILDQADHMSRKCRLGLEKIDELPQALFVELFGNPITNPKQWPVSLLSEAGKLERGVSKHRPRNDPALLGGPYPLVQTGDVANSHGYIRAHSGSYSEAGLRQSRLWPKGTLCITIAANIGKTGILQFDACFPDSVVGFTPGPAITTEYVRIWMSFIEGKLEALAPQFAQKNINLAILGALPLAIPPLPLQQRFIAMLKSIDRLIFSQRKYLLHLDRLVASLQSEEFAGTVAPSSSSNRRFSQLDEAKLASV